jgi:predicted nucleic acid-binding protein
VRRIVADASALVEYLLGSELGAGVTATITDSEADLHVPALCDIEVVSALRGLLRGKKIDLRRALEAVEDYVALPVTRHGHLALLERALELRENLSAYDAAYVALAEQLSATLVTCDEPLARSVRAHLPGLELVALTTATS